MVKNIELSKSTRETKKIYEVGNINVFLADTIFSKSRFWKMAVSDITPAELVAYVATQNSLGKGREANSSVGVVLDEINKAIVNGEIKPNLLDQLTIDISPRPFGLKVVN